MYTCDAFGGVGLHARYGDAPPSRTSEPDAASSFTWTPEGEDARKELLKLFTRPEEEECDESALELASPQPSDGAPAPSPPPFGRATSPPIPIPDTGMPHQRAWESCPRPLPSSFSPLSPPRARLPPTFVAVPVDAQLPMPLSASAVKRRTVRFAADARGTIDPDTEGLDAFEL